MNDKTTISNNTLNLDSLMAKAQSIAGLTDFGDTDFVSRAKEWLNSAEQDGSLSDSGRAGLDALVTGWLVNRLRFARDLKNNPAILKQEIHEPVFVTGLPRTGTSKLQRVLSCDTTMQSLPFWIVLNMAPFPDADPAVPDPRIATAVSALEIMATQFPQFQTAHPVFADEPEEECYWAESDFQSMAGCTRVRVPAYLRKVMNSTTAESYPFFKRALQYVQWQRGENGQRPWILKTPNHLGNLPTVMETFPGATVIHTYRDPVVTMASICGIFEIFRSLTTDVIDLEEIGAEQLLVWSTMAQRHMEQRQDPAIDSRVIDVHYDDTCSHAIDLVKSIYQRRGKTLSHEAEQAMREWEVKYPQHQFGRHKYSLEKYGLTEEKVRTTFAEYIARFSKTKLPR